MSPEGIVTPRFCAASIKKVDILEHVLKKKPWLEVALAIEHRHRVARLQEASGHWSAHNAEADESYVDFHAAFHHVKFSEASA